MAIIDRDSPDGNENGYREFIKPSEGSAYEIVRDYIETSRGTIIPSSKNMGGTSNEVSGLQINGFNPNEGSPEIIDEVLDPAMETDIPKVASAPISAVKAKAKAVKLNAEATKTGAVAVVTVPPAPISKPKSRFIDPAETPTKTLPDPIPLQQNKIAEPKAVVHFHLPGLRIPYKFHEVIVDIDRCLLVFILDVRSSVDSPEFEPTKEGEYLTFSFGDPMMRYFCSYHGQSFVAAGNLMQHIFVIVDSEPYQS